VVVSKLNNNHQECAVTVMMKALGDETRVKILCDSGLKRIKRLIDSISLKTEVQ
jgi:hypothetical protein